MNLAPKLRALTPRRSALLCAALLAVSGASLAVKLLHFKRIAAWLAKQRSFAATPPDIELLTDIGWAVRVIAHRVPFRAVCLEQALAAALITNGLRVPTTLYLGVANAADGRLEAHAWLSAHSKILTGAAGHQRYRVVAAFATGTAPQV